MKSLTVFTPTYNRAFCLGQLYESLCRQTEKDFLWMIVDDGSTDGTDALVNDWQSQNRVEILYLPQQNQGMHGAHNTAYRYITTELNVCIDSDDFMPDDAVEKILTKWKEHGDQAGIIGLDAFKDGSIVGKKIPDGLKESTLSGLYQDHGITGDKKVVLRTDVVREFPPYPLFEGERFVPLGTLYLMIDQKYKFLCSNEVLCIVEYLPDGSSRNIFKQYRKHPNGFRYSRLVEMKYAKRFRYRFTRAMHLVSSSIFARRIDIFKDNPNPLVTLVALPFGIALHGYILWKGR